MMDNRSSSCCRKKYRLSCVRSKGAILVLLLCFFFYTIASIFSPQVFKPLRARAGLTEFFNILFGGLSALCILYPLLGLLGEYWKRYIVVMSGAVILSVSTITLIVIVLSFIILKLWIPLYVLSSIVAFFYFISLCLFEANIIQFGADQLHFAPSEELSSFVHWLSWVRAVSFFFISLMATAFLESKLSVFYAVYGIVVGAIIVATIGVYLMLPFRRHLVIEPAQRNNPVKLIWRVMRYAWNHKQPERRSAFTYGEGPPSRLDVGKERYGGPFTTVQVEDVKSFCFIISIIFGSFGFSIQESIYNLYNVTIPVPLNSSDSDLFIDGVVLNLPALLPYFVVTVVIPIHQLLIVPYFSHCIPGILIRIWIGLVLVLIQLVIFTGINSKCATSTDCSDNLFRYGLVVLQVLAGMSNMLVFIGILEFILAQAPRTMQGILIGLWLMQYYYFHYMDVLTSYYISRHSKGYIYYFVKTALVLISIIIYTIAAYKYKYRQCNELSDVNERVIITEYTERQLDREEQLDRDENNSGYTSFYILSEVY